MGSQKQGERTARCRGLQPGVALLLAAVFLLSAATPARAAFHEVLVREVHAGGAANDSYVVLQAYSPGQNVVGGHSLTAHSASGATIATFTFPGSVVNGENQMTMLVADTGYGGSFPSGPAPDGTSAGFDLSPAGGAVCWAGIDCVSWGAFTGTTSPTAGSPASPSGIPAGSALRRTIAPGCQTMLEPTDDSDVSATDFLQVAPNPRANSSPIVEAPCPSLPNTTIGGKPSSPTKSTSASFSFSATPPEGASFECKLDTGSFAPCTSPSEYSGLSEATHTFEVRAVNSAGTDPSPARHEWRVDLTPPTTAVLTHPNDPSPGNSASFTYNASETGASFQCSLERSGDADDFSACASSGKAYPDAQHPGPLADGSWTFKVRASDQAGNLGTGTAFTWTVDNSLADTTPPQTTIGSVPGDPSASSTASFTYASSEAGSTFECALDGAGFAPCPAAGVQYTGLAAGPHAFQVRATDLFGNTDPTPAGYSWSVAIPLSAPPAPPPSPSTRAPETRLVVKPAATIRDRTPTFRFRSDRGGASFECRLDRGPFRSCRSPFTPKPLSFGAHVFRVRALLAGQADPSPATARFRVRRVAASRSPTATTSDFHLISVREVYPGSAAQPDAEYVELQAYAAGQNFVGGHTLSFRSAGGATTGSQTFAADVADGRNQMTVLVATAAAESAFGVLADQGMPPHLIEPAGGAVCFEALDCVAWGAFGGALPSPAGSPAAPAGIPDGMALRRTIAPGCATLLESADDRNDGALDFSAVFPAPRPNSFAPAERPCTGPGSGGGAGQGAERAPETTIVRFPRRRTRDRTPTFRFTAEGGAGFQCRLDRRTYRACRSPFTVRRLSLGWHVFRVRARDATGLLDPSPASYRFRVLPRR